MVFLHQGIVMSDERAPVSYYLMPHFLQDLSHIYVSSVDDFDIYA